MSIQEAIKQRDSKDPIDQELMTWTAQEYIRIRKSRDVKIRIRPIHTIDFGRGVSNPDIDKLTLAFCHAVGWFKNNGYEMD